MADETRAESDFRLPDSAPSTIDAENLRGWDAYVDESIAQAASNAEKWRAGLAGFVSLLFTVLVFSGPSNFHLMASPWGLVALLCFVAGVVALVAALWIALAASAPAMRLRRRDQIVPSGQSIRAHRIAVAIRTERNLVYARTVMVGALALVLAGLVVWGTAPLAEEVKTAPVLFELTLTSGGDPVCGELLSSSSGVIVLKVGDSSSPVQVELTEIVALSVPEECPPS